MSFLRNSLKLCQSGLNIILSTTKTFHTLNRPTAGGLITTLKSAQLLIPRKIDFVLSCGFKVKGILRRRCKDCFLVRREERLFVICKTHPRHKQMSMVKKPRNTWILSHATQGKVRPW